jgi:hypothetical protein
MLKRNRKRQTTTLEDRLLKFAEDARAAANRESSSSERDTLIKKAEKAEAMSTATGRFLYADAAFGKLDSSPFVAELAMPRFHTNRPRRLGLPDEAGRYHGSSAAFNGEREPFRILLRRAPIDVKERPLSFSM